MYGIEPISKDKRTPNSVAGRRRSAHWWEIITMAAIPTGIIFSLPLKMIMVAYRMPMPPEKRQCCEASATKIPSMPR